MKNLKGHQMQKEGISRAVCGRHNLYSNPNKLDHGDYWGDPSREEGLQWSRAKMPSAQGAREDIQRIL